MKNSFLQRNLFASHASFFRPLRAALGQIRKAQATRCGIINRSLRPVFLALSLASLLSPMMAHARNYEVINADVPFKFNVGKRSFRPGHYQFIPVGPGLLSMRDSHEHVIASLITRSREADGPARATQLIFNLNKKKHSELAEILMANHSQVIDVLREEVVTRPAAPLKLDLPPWEIDALLNRLQQPRPPR